MRLIFLLALKSLTSKATRTACSIIAISIGLGTAIAIFTLDYNTILSQRLRLRKQYGEPDLELRPSNKYRADIAGLEKKLLDVRGIKTLAPIFFYSINLYLAPDKPLNIFLCGFTPQGNERFKAYRLVAGQDLPTGNTKAILLTSSIAQKYHIRLGEYVDLKYIIRSAAEPVSTKCFSLKKKNLKRPLPTTSEQWGKFKVVGFIAPEHLGAKNKAQVGIVPFYAGVDFLSDTPLFPFFWAQTVSGYPLDKLKAELDGMVGISKPSFAIVGESSMERAFRNGVHICAFFALGLGLFVVFSSFSMSLMERIKQFGLLKLVGATSGQICLIFLTEAIIIAVIASGLGLVLGLGLTKILIKFRITTLGLGKPIHSFHIPWFQVLGIMGLGIVMDFWGALYPMLKARNISPVRAIYPRESEMGFKARKTSKVLIVVCLAVFCFLILPYLAAGKQARIFVLSGLGSVVVFFIFLALIPAFCKYFTQVACWCLAPFYKVESLLAKRNIENSSSRVRFSVCALMLVVATVLSLKTMIRGMDREIDDWAQTALQDRAFIYSSRALSPQELNPLRDLPMVQALIPMSATVTTPYFIKGVAPATLAKFGPLAERTNSALYKKFAQTDSLIISTQFARNYNLKSGEHLTMQTSEGKINFTILAIMDDYGFFPFQRSYALMDEAKLAKYFCISTDKISQISIKLNKDYSYLDLRREILHRIQWPAQFYTPEGKFIISMTNADETKKIFHDNIRPNFIIFDVILYMIVILIGVGTLNSLLISALERKKEIGLMRVVGMTANQISRTLLIEGGMIGLVGGVLGVLMGIVLSGIAINGLEVISGLKFGYPLSFFWIITSFLGSIVLSTVAGIYPAKRTKQFSVIQAIQYE